MSEELARRATETHYDSAAVDRLLKRWDYVEGDDLACVREWTPGEVLTAMGAHKLTSTCDGRLLSLLTCYEAGPRGSREFFRDLPRGDLLALTRDCCNANAGEGVWLRLMVLACALPLPDTMDADEFGRLPLAFIETMLALIEALPGVSGE